MIELKAKVELVDDAAHHSYAEVTKFQKQRSDKTEAVILARYDFVCLQLTKLEAECQARFDNMNERLRATSSNG